MNIERRIKKAEEKLQIDKEPRPFVLMISKESSLDEQTRESLGPIETWITFQRQLRRVSPDCKFMLFLGSAEGELEARRQCSTSEGAREHE